jgi:hypothetical protein
MSFKKIEGFKPKIFVPEEQPRNQKKHNCKDCFSCQWCSDDRCERCLGRKNKDLKQAGEDKNNGK